MSKVLLQSGLYLLSDLAAELEFGSFTQLCSKRASAATRAVPSIRVAVNVIQVKAQHATEALLFSPGTKGDDDDAVE